MNGEILIGDARTMLAGIETGTIDCCVTSPPYYGLRDYGVEAQIGRGESVEDVARNLGVAVVPVVGRGTLRTAINVVKTTIQSVIAATPGTLAEGLVMRPAVELIDRRGRRVITKVKARDFI